MATHETPPLPSQQQQQQQQNHSPHDLLALGEISTALTLPAQYSNQEYLVADDNINNNDDDDDDETLKHHHQQHKLKSHHIEQVIRLPLLLRLLSSSQNLGSIPSDPTSFFPSSPSSIPPDGDKEEEAAAAAEKIHQYEIDSIVSKLEIVAASYPAAEGVDLLSSSLAPYACRKISKCPALKRNKRVVANSSGGGKGSGGLYKWNVEQLDTICTALSTGGSFGGGGRRKRKRSSDVGLESENDEMLPYDDEEEEDGDSYGSDNNEQQQGGGGGGGQFDDAEEEEATPISSQLTTPTTTDTPTNRMLAELSDKKPSTKKRKKKDSIDDENGGGEGGGTLLFSRASISAEDSQESSVSRTLVELTSLVLDSLKKPLVRTDDGDDGQNNEDDENENKDSSGGADGSSGTARDHSGESGTTTTDKPDDDEEGQNNDDTAAMKGSKGKCIALSVKSDSLLGEPSTTGGGNMDYYYARASSGGGGATGTDLSATITALLYHAPVLRHRHVANALCRASVPQTSEIIHRMAANCPASSSSIVRGCIDAYIAASSSSPKTKDPPAVKATIAKTAISAVTSVASLSKKEASRVAVTLNECRVMPALMLRLWLEVDVFSAAAILIEGLSSISKNSSGGGSVKEKKKSDTKVEKGDNKAKRDIKASASTISGGGGGSSGGDSKKAPKIRKVRKIRSQPIRTFPTRHSKKGNGGDLKQYGRRIASALVEDKSLAEEARSCLVSCLESMFSNLNGSESSSSGVGAASMHWGGATLIMRAYALLVYQTGIGAGSSSGSGSKFVERAMQAIGALVKIKPAGQKNNNCISTNHKISDRFRTMALCAAIITCAEFPPIGDSHHGKNFIQSDASEACKSCLLSLLQSSSASLCYSVFLSRIAAFIDSEDATELQQLVVCSILANENDGKDAEMKLSPHSPAHDNENDNEAAETEKDSKDDAFFNVCRWASSKLVDIKWDNLVKLGLSPDALLTDVMAAVDAMRRCHATDEQLDKLVKDTLDDPSRCAILFNQAGIVMFLAHAVNMLLKRPEPRIPLILPIQLERIALKISLQHSYSNSQKSKSLYQVNEADGLRCQFLLQLFYAFLFFDRTEQSAFTIDPRTLPLGEALAFCRSCIESQERHASEVKCLHSQLHALASVHCPEVMEMPLPSTENSASCGLLTSDRGAITPDKVSNVIRECLHGDNKNDPSGCRAERFFLQSRAHYHSATVDAKAACALLSTRHSPPPFFTYSALCRDPLVLLKCHMSAWKCKGLRRIILTVLQRVLDANDFITCQSALTDEVAIELLSVRDTIVVRCLLVAGSGGFVLGNGKKELSSPTHCPMTVGFIRSMVAKQHGLVAMLLKQGLPEAAVDWLVEFIPESLSDSSVITSCLSERNTLTAAERLTMADAALRIAIVHGSRDESQAQPLAYAALAVLVSSFFLVLGPIGVPVNVICEEGGQDVTQVCRKATFRMLKAMQKIRGSRLSLKNEANMALSKIAGLCKSEGAMSGVGGSVANKRKALLKEIWDAVARANNAMGGTLQI